MRLFRRVPSWFAISYLSTGLIREAIQKRKADKYAAQVVHYYDDENPGPSPYHTHSVGTLQEALEQLDDLIQEKERQK